LIDSFQIAAIETTVEDMPVFLDGYFIKEGLLFAKALCEGACPTKGGSVRIGSSRLNSARQNMMMLSRPFKLKHSTD